LLVRLIGERLKKNYFFLGTLKNLNIIGHYKMPRAIKGRDFRKNGKK